jgi:hypothetical protein
MRRALFWREADLFVPTPTRTEGSLWLVGFQGRHMLNVRHKAMSPSSNKTSHILVAAAVVIAAGAIVSFYFGKTLHPPGIVHAQLRVEPFLLERTLSERRPPAGLSPSLAVSIARRSDGTTATVESVGPLASPRFVRKLAFLDGRVLSLVDSMRIKSTGPRLSEEEAGSLIQSLTVPSPDCGAKTPELLRHDTYSGQEVAVIQSLIPNKYRVTYWRAPKLGCEALYYTTEEIHADGTFTLVSEAKTSRLVLGDPDPRLFDLGEAYEEVKPSEARRRLLADLNLKLSPEELKRYEDES